MRRLQKQRYTPNLKCGCPEERLLMAENSHDTVLGRQQLKTTKSGVQVKGNCRWSAQACIQEHRLQSRSISWHVRRRCNRIWQNLDGARFRSHDEIVGIRPQSMRSLDQRGTVVPFTGQGRCEWVSFHARNSYGSCACFRDLQRCAKKRQWWRKFQLYKS